MEWRRGDYAISTDRERLDRDAIHRYLSEEAYRIRRLMTISHPSEVVYPDGD